MVRLGVYSKKPTPVQEFRIEGSSFFFAGHFVHPHGFSMDFHVHDFFEFSCVLGGRGHYEVVHEDHVETIPVREHTILLWDGQTPHRAVDVPGEPLEQIILLFDYSYISSVEVAPRLHDLTDSSGKFVLSGRGAGKEFVDDFRAVLIEQRQLNVGRSDMMRALLTSLLVRLFRYEVLSPSRLMSVSDVRISRAIDYGLRNFDRSVSVPEVAQVACLSERHFCELFQQHTGFSWLQFLHELRILNAKALLTRTNMKVIDIAVTVGYSTGPLFARWFSRVVGCSPSAFREQSLRTLARDAHMLSHASQIQEIVDDLQDVSEVNG